MRPVWAEFEECLKDCHDLESVEIAGYWKNVEQKDREALTSNFSLRFRKLLKVEQFYVPDEVLTDRSRRQGIYRGESQHYHVDRRI